MHLGHLNVSILKEVSHLDTLGANAKFTTKRINVHKKQQKNNASWEQQNS
jgi:hypothetical protein